MLIYTIRVAGRSDGYAGEKAWAYSMPSDPFFQGEPPSLIAALASAVAAQFAAIVALCRHILKKDKVIEDKDRIIQAVQEARIQEHKESAAELTTARRILDRAIDTVQSVRSSGDSKR